MKRRPGQVIKLAKPEKKIKRPKKTPFAHFTCRFDSRRCKLSDSGLCKLHKTSTGKTKVDCIVNKEHLRLTLGANVKVEFKCDVCSHPFKTAVKHVTQGGWCGMCSSSWKHCGKTDCTFCFGRSLASYKGLTIKGNPKVECIVNTEHLRLPLNSDKKTEFKCDVCSHPFKTKLNHVTQGGWCGMCSSSWKHCGKADCTFCFGRSLASYKGLTIKGNRKVECIVDKEHLQDILRLPLGSRDQVEFKCDVCSHPFKTAVQHVTQGNWCRMCSSNWKHCGKTDCTFCFGRSLASYKGLTIKGNPKVECIVNKEHLRLPLNSDKKTEFKCDVCSHPFKTKVNHVTEGKWCRMCSSNWKHCGKTDCTFCFGRSLASYKGLTSKGNRKVECIVDKEHLQDILRLPLGGRDKVEFKCDICSHPFETPIRYVTRGTWCPHCKNKTELKVFGFLTKELNFKVNREYRPSFQWRDYKLRRRFDFLLVEFDIILEIDGPQHTEEVSKTWIRTTLFQRQIVDKWKEFLARRDGKRIFRFNQHAIWTDSYDWKRDIKRLVQIKKFRKISF